MAALLSKSERDATPSQPHATQPPRYDPDLNLLRDPRDPSRFCCVYPVGRNRWRARVMKRLPLGTHDTQLAAAGAVLDFYRRTYGDQWRLAWRRRKANPWRVRRVKKGGSPFYVADVYVDGRPVRVTLADTRRPTGAAHPAAERARLDAVNRKRRWAREMDVYLWLSREDARRAVRRFCYWQLGLVAPFRLWRG